MKKVFILRQNKEKPKFLLAKLIREEEQKIRIKPSKREEKEKKNCHLKKQQRKHKILSFYEAMKWHEISLPAFFPLASSLLRIDKIFH